MSAGSGSTLAFRHLGLPGEHVTAGWDRFLASLRRFVDAGEGEPFGMTTDALRLVRTYHEAWTRRDFVTAARCLASDLATDVPLNAYVGRDDFVAALTGFASLVGDVNLIVELANEDQVLLVYDMHSERYGTIRVAEHFTVDDGQIQQIRHVHDTVALRAAA